MKRRNVGIVLFDEVEVLDFAGPFEVFSRARLEPGMMSRRSEDTAPFHVFTVSRDGAMVSATGGLRVQPDHAFGNHPPIGVLLVPGGLGTRAMLEDVATLDWVRDTARTAELVTSVCTGSLVLARCGLLAGRRATTHWGALELLRDLGVEVDAAARFVDDGIVTSAGVSAGIDMAFHVVERFCGKAVADETARYMDYPRR